MKLLQLSIWTLGFGFSIMLAFYSPITYLGFCLGMGLASATGTFTAHRRLKSPLYVMAISMLLGFAIGSFFFPIAVVALLYKNILKKPLLTCSGEE